MIKYLHAFVAICFLVFGQASANGLSRISVPLGDGVTPLQGAVWYPCAEAGGVVVLREVSLAGTLDCPITGTGLPMIVISHGARGWFGGHHDTAAALADAGFVVAAITHPDLGRRSWRTNRPAEVRRLIDHMVQDWPGRASLDVQKIGFFGFSRGGYTGLVLAGAEPGFWRLLAHCMLNSEDLMCVSSGSSEPEAEAEWTAEDYTHDQRISAAVIAAPLAQVFSDGELSDITIPVQLWRAELDQLLPFPNHAEKVHQARETGSAYTVVENAGHFAFLPPCTGVQREAAEFICKDDPAFDRAKFHVTFNQAVIAFFRQHFGMP
jgi:predicted dienelactone hydrolase